MIDSIDRPVWTASIDVHLAIPASGVFGMTQSHILPARRSHISRDEFERLMAGGPNGQWSRLSEPKAA
jgi:hypothetical protein